MRNIDKLIQVVGHMLSLNGGSLNYTKLIKTIYLADKECLRRYDYTITGDTYSSCKNGPVLDKLYDLIDGHGSKEERAKWCIFFRRSDYELEQIQATGDGELNDAEIETLNHIDSEYKDKDYRYLINEKNKSRLYPEWQHPSTKGAGKLKELLPIRDILRHLGKSKDEIDYVLNDMREADYRESLFTSSRR